MEPKHETAVPGAYVRLAQLAFARLLAARPLTKPVDIQIAETLETIGYDVSVLK